MEQFSEGGYSVFLSIYCYGCMYFLPLIYDWVTKATDPGAEKKKHIYIFSWTLQLLLRGVPWGLLPFEHGQKIFRGRHPGGIRIRCLNHLSYPSINSPWRTEFLTQSGWAWPPYRGNPFQPLVSFQWWFIPHDHRCNWNVNRPVNLSGFLFCWAISSSQQNQCNNSINVNASPILFYRHCTRSRILEFIYLSLEFYLHSTFFFGWEPHPQI